MFTVFIVIFRLIFSCGRKSNCTRSVKNILKVRHTATVLCHCCCCKNCAFHKTTKKNVQMFAVYADLSLSFVWRFWFRSRCKKLTVKRILRWSNYHLVKTLSVGACHLSETGSGRVERHVVERRIELLGSLRNNGRDPFNQNFNRSDREKRTTSKGGPVFSKLFRLDRTDPLSFGPTFPEILVEWIAPTVFT